MCPIHGPPQDWQLGTLTGRADQQGSRDVPFDELMLATFTGNMQSHRENPIFFLVDSRNFRAQWKESDIPEVKNTKHF